MVRVTVIGAGPGGYTAAFEAAKTGAAVTLVESGSLGGTCLNQGCVPTKIFRTAAETLALSRRFEELGISLPAGAAVNLPALVARKKKVINVLQDGLKKQCATLGVRLVSGAAKIVHPGLVAVSGDSSEPVLVAGDKIIIATGSLPFSLPALPFDHRHILSSDDLLTLERVPERLLIVGGGVIGAEFACIFAELGSKVVVVETQSRLLPLPSVDEDISLLLAREMKKRKITVELARCVTHCTPSEKGLEVTLGPSPLVSPDALSEHARQESLLETDLVAVTVGRTPNTAGLGLKDVGVTTDKRGYIVSDAYFQTTIPNIYAIGDVLGPGKIMLAHVASAEGRVAAANCLGAKRTLSYAAVPSGIFTSPEIGEVGLTEAQAVASGLAVTSSLFQLRGLGKAQILGELSGFVKIVAEKASRKIVGVHIAGAHATELIAEGTLALQLGARIEDLVNTIHAHPTMAEGFAEVACTM